MKPSLIQSYAIIYTKVNRQQIMMNWYCKRSNTIYYHVKLCTVRLFSTVTVTKQFDKEVPVCIQHSDKEVLGLLSRQHLAREKS